MSSRYNHNDQELNRGEHQEHQVKLHQSVTAVSTSSEPVIVTSTTGTIASTSCTYSCSSFSCNSSAGNGNNGNNNNFHRARRRLDVPTTPVGQYKDSMAQIADDNNGYHEVKNLHHHHHRYHHSQVAQHEQSRHNEDKTHHVNATVNSTAAAAAADLINTQSHRDICNCDLTNASSSKRNDIRDKHVIRQDDTKYEDEETDGVNQHQHRQHHHNVPSDDTHPPLLSSKCIHARVNTNECEQDPSRQVKCNITNESVVMSNVKGMSDSGNLSSSSSSSPSREAGGVGGISFSPSPEILFLVREHAKTLKTLSCISKRLEQLEYKVCDIQRTVNNSNTMQLSCMSSSSASSCNLHCNSNNCNDLLCKTRCKCSHGEHGDVIAASSGKKHGGNNGNILSDDSGGEYSRTTNGTVADEDELISLLDQIAKCSQQIRDTQVNQVAAANHYLAMSNSNSLQGTSKESSQGTLVSDTRQHSTLLPFACSSSNPVSSHHQQQQHRHHQHISNDIVSSSPIASCSISRHNSNSSGRMLPGTSGRPLDLSDSPGFMGNNSPLRNSRNNSSPLSALLFDPNISNVLTNLQDELTNDASTIVNYNNTSSFLNPLVNNTRRYTIGDIGVASPFHENNGATGITHTGGHPHVDPHNISTSSTAAGTLAYQHQFNNPHPQHHLHRSSLCNNHLVNVASSSSSSPSAASANRSRMPSISSQQQQQQHVSPAFLSTASSHSVQKSQQEILQQQQQPRLTGPPQGNNNPFTSVSLRRQSNDNNAYNLHADIEILDLGECDDDKSSKKTRSTGVNRVSSSSSTSSSSSSSSSSATINNNSHLNMLKFDHVRRFVQQRERDECKIACDAADEWLAKYSSNAIISNSASTSASASTLAAASSSSSCSAGGVTNVTAVSTPTTATITNSLVAPSFNSNASTTATSASAAVTASASSSSSLRGRNQHVTSSSPHQAST